MALIVPAVHVCASSALQLVRHMQLLDVWDLGHNSGGVAFPLLGILGFHFRLLVGATGAFDSFALG